MGDDNRKDKQMMNWKPLLSTMLLFLSGISYGQSPIYDLVIQDVKVFDSRTKKVHKNRSILINADTIVSVISASRTVKAKKIIAGANRLVVPGFVDTHTHLRNVYGSLEQVDTTGLDRKKLATTYLNYGTTTLVDMGMPEAWMGAVLHWQKNPLPAYPNIYISGGALVSPEAGRKTYMNHASVNNSDIVRLKINDYADKGLAHMKIYWRLRKSELETAVSEGKKRNMTISAHIDQNVTSMSEAIDLGVKNFEHMLSLPPAILILNNHYVDMKKKYGLGSVDNVDKLLAQIILFFDYIKENPEWDSALNALFDKMAQNKVSLSTTIHVMGSVAGRTYFFTSLSPDDTINLSNYTLAQKQQLSMAFDTMMQYLKVAQDKGVKIRIGTDCRNGGKALLSELLLLHEANFTTEDILQIATLNGAEAMHIEDKYGSIEMGKKADLVLFDKDPFANYQNFLAKKIVVKGGVTVEN